MESTGELGYRCNSTLLTSILESAKFTNKPTSLFSAFKYDLTWASDEHQHRTQDI